MLKDFNGGQVLTTDNGYTLVAYNGDSDYQLYSRKDRKIYFIDGLTLTAYLLDFSLYSQSDNILFIEDLKELSHTVKDYI